VPETDEEVIREGTISPPQLKQNTAGAERPLSGLERRNLYRALDRPHKPTEIPSHTEIFEEGDWEFINATEKEELSKEEPFDWELEEGLRPIKTAAPVASPVISTNLTKPPNFDLFESEKNVGIDLPLFAIKPQDIEVSLVGPQTDIERLLQDERQEQADKRVEESEKEIAKGAIEIPEAPLWELRFPTELASQLHLTRHNHKICFDRIIAAGRRDLEMIDFSSTIFQQFIQQAKAYGFYGVVAAIKHSGAQSIATAILRWQNDHGRRMRQEFAGVIIRPDSLPSINSQELADWLLEKKESAVIEQNIELGKNIYSQTESVLDKRLGELSNRHLHPDSIEIVAMSWCK